MNENDLDYADELSDLEELMQGVTEENMDDFFSFIELLDGAKKAGTLFVDTSTFYH